MFGGLPAAVAEAAAGAADPSPETKRVLADQMLREVRRKDASEPALYALLERVARSLGSRTDWSKLAREMAVPLGTKRRRRKPYDPNEPPNSPRTVQGYLEFLATGYFILIVHFWKRDSDSSSLPHGKKLYLGDPLLYTIARDHAPGLSFDAAAAVENAIGIALYRRYERIEDQLSSFLAPSDLHVWGTSGGGEIDFVCGPRSRPDIVEVKYQTTVDRRIGPAMSRAFPQRPIVIATKNELAFTERYALIPASLLLWALL